MLDMSIPYKNILMRLANTDLIGIVQPVLPHGYAFRFYRDGDENHWARIEASVLEFKTEAEAVVYFTNNYLVKSNELYKRCVFVLNPEGLPIATSTAWFVNNRLGHQASMAWVAVCPEYQGLGIGKAIIQKALCLYAELEPGADVFLHTQTWSHKAIRLYHYFGFRFIQSKDFVCLQDEAEGNCIHQNDCHEAMQILRDIYDSDTYSILTDTVY